jgi:hypothetical protein
MEPGSYGVDEVRRSGMLPKANAPLGEGIGTCFDMIDAQEEKVP